MQRLVVPAEEVPAMDKDQVKRIMSLAYANPILGQGGNASFIIEEVALDFTTCMNKIVFDANHAFSDSPDDGPEEAPRPPPPHRWSVRVWDKYVYMYPHPD